MNEQTLLSTRHSSRHRHHTTAAPPSRSDWGPQTLLPRVCGFLLRGDHFSIGFWACGVCYISSKDFNTIHIKLLTGLQQELIEENLTQEGRLYGCELTECLSQWTILQQ